MPTFSLVISPPLLTVRLQPDYDAPLPLAYSQVRSFGGKFSPVTFSAQDLSTSELLRTL